MNKKIKTILAVGALCSVSYAGNVDQGRIEIGGSAEMSTVLEQNGFSEFQVNPFAMFYLAPGFALGGSIGFMTGGNSNNSSSTISIGPRAAYYFDIGVPLLYPFIACGLDFDYWSSGGSHTNTFSVPIESGIRIFMNDFVAADIGLNFDFGNGAATMEIGAGFSMFLR